MEESPRSKCYGGSGRKIPNSLRDQSEQTQPNSVCDIYQAN